MKSVLLFAALAISGTATNAVRGDSSVSRSQLAFDFREQLRDLAAKCESLGLAELARQTLDWSIERDPRRQYLFLPRSVPEGNLAQPSSDLAAKWLAKLQEIRQEYARRLFDLAKSEATDGSATTAFQLLHEVLYLDPIHRDASRILRAVPEESKPRSRQPRVAHGRFGWAKGKWWQIDSPHFQVSTDADQESGVELAKRLEEFHLIWRQLFFVHWASREWLVGRFAGENAPRPAERKHQVALFRNREEYLRQLSPAEPKIALTLAYYQKGSKTSFFYAGDDSVLSVWYHETAHQLFQETGNPVPDVGERWNFWVVEGIAVYLESAVKHDGYFTVGGFDADRLQFARSRLMGGDPLLPIVELSALGRESLQGHPEIRKLYTQSAGLTHFLLNSRDGRDRDEFVQRIAVTYRGQDNPRTFTSLPTLGDASLEQSYREFLMVSDSDLRFLGRSANRRNLSLASAKIHDDSLKHLAGSDQLEWLDLAYTPVTTVGIANLGVLPRLKRLTLVNTRVSDAVAEKITALPCLEELDLSGTAITDAALPYLNNLKQLRVLRLAHTAVTDAGVGQLSRLTNLEGLDVDQTQVTTNAVNQLKHRFPKIR